jgi:hypothetical protein
MGRFSEIDLELTYGEKPTTPPRVGSFGVCLNDPKNPPRFYTLVEICGSFGMFNPVDNPELVQEFDLCDFWQLT